MIKFSNVSATPSMRGIGKHMPINKAAFTGMIHNATTFMSLPRLHREIPYLETSRLVMAINATIMAISADSAMAVYGLYPNIVNGQ